MYRSTFLIPITILLAATSATPAGASKGKVVRYSDLDLTSPAGIATLDRRIAAAINKECESAEPHYLRAVGEVRRCRLQAMADLEGQRANAISKARFASGFQPR